MTITPLPAGVPHREAAAASWSTEMDWISLGLMLSIEPSYGKLSTTISGCVLENSVLRQRMLMPSGLPVFLSDRKPLVSPSILLSMLVDVHRFITALSRN